MKKGIFRISAFIFLITLGSLSTTAQTPSYLIIKGVLLSELNSTDSSSIQISKNEKLQSIVAPVALDGRFRLELEYNSEYKLTFRKKGHFAKTVIVNTEVPTKASTEKINSSYFLMAVKLFSDIQNPENFYPGNQVQYVSYFPNTNNFRRVPTVLDYQYVEKGNLSSISTSAVSSKSKSQNYQVF